VTQKVWYCPNCGYEVTSRGRCHSCGERLVSSPLAELESGPDDDEVGYRIDEWDSETRARLIEALINAGLRHRFEEEELVILAVDEAEADKIVAEVTGTARPPSHDWDDDDDEAHEPEGERGARIMGRDLYEAASRLRQDPTDMSADVALGEASAAVFTLDYVPGLDDEHLAAVGRVTRRLLGALGADEALEDEIRHQAEVLCRLVAPSAGMAEAEAERARIRLTAAAKEQQRSLDLPTSDAAPGGDMLAAGAALTSDADIPTAGSGPGEGAGASSEPAASTGPLAVAGPLAAAGPPAAAGPVAGAGTGLVAGAGAVTDEEAEDDEGDEDIEGEEGEEEEEDSGELVYELGEWLPEQRIEMSMLLESAGIAYRWDATDLTVAEEHEEEVDGLFEQVHGIADEDDEARYRTIEELFGSVDRLANDPGDPERRRAFLEAVGAVEQPTPVGVDDAYWWRVRSQGHAVVAAVEADARDDEISREAALLAEMLHEMV
jgi:hypothetical protein